METNTITGYQVAEQTSNRIADELEKIAAVANNELGLTELTKIVRDQADARRADRFLIAMFGEFNVGKSTVLSAMMGRDVLPRSVLESTAVITEIDYGDPAFVEVFFLRDKDGNVVSTTPANGNENSAQSLHGDDIPAYEEPPPVSARDLQTNLTADETWHNLADFKKSYTVSQHDKEDQGDTDSFSHVAYSVMHFPIQLCKYGVRLVDTPGLNASPIREQRTREYLIKADAVIFVLDASRFMGDRERGYLNNKLADRKGSIFFLVNKWNTIVQHAITYEEAEQEKAVLRRKFQRELAPYCVTDDGRDVSAQRIFLVDAIAALKGRAIPDQANLLTDSGIPSFEAALQHFLIEDRRRTTNRAVLNFVKWLTDELRTSINGGIAAAGKSLPEIEREIAEVKPKLDRIKQLLTLMLNRLDVVSHRLQRQVFESYVAEIEKLVKDLQANRVRIDLQKVFDDSLFNSVLLQTLKAKLPWSGDDEKIENKIHKVVELQLKAIVEKRMKLWQDSSLKNLLANANKTAVDELKIEAREYRQVLEQVEQITGQHFNILDPDELIRKWLSYDPKLALQGQNLSVNPLTGIGVDIGVLVTGLGVDIAAEVTGHAVAAAVIPIAGIAFSAWRMWRRERKAKENLTSKVVTSTIDGLHKSVNEQQYRVKSEEAITSDIKKRFDEIQAALSTGINLEIEIIDGRLKNLLEKKKEAKLSEDEIKARLAASRTTIERALASIELAVRS